MTNAADEFAAGLPGHSTVVIIGAGPAGLALGRELQRRRVPFLILEKGRIAESWCRMPNALKLISPWKCNWLERTTRARFSPNAELTRQQYLDYLRDFATLCRLPVVSNCAVQSVERF